MGAFKQKLSFWDACFNVLLVSSVDMDVLILSIGLGHKSETDMEWDIFTEKSDWIN